MDIEIAATVWAHGYDLVTADQSNFQKISQIVSEAQPIGPPLRVRCPGEQE
jgi:predicted nucleic acid-binding protein